MEFGTPQFWVAAVETIITNILLSVDNAVVIALERYPLLAMAGGGLLGFVAGEMAVTDTAIATWVDTSMHWLHWVVPAAGVLLMIGLATYLKQRRTAAREHVSGPRRHVTARH